MQYQANALEQHWMPFTGNRDFKENPRLVVKAEGMHYWDHKGGKILDGAAGLFCCAAGHGRPEIAEAVYKQLQEADYAPHFQMGHPASFELARKLCNLTPEGIDHVFFVNSGSEAIDTALKMAMAYRRAKGDGREGRRAKGGIRRASSLRCRSRTCGRPQDPARSAQAHSAER